MHLVIIVAGERESRWMATKENEELLDPGMQRQTGDDGPDVAFHIELKH